MKLISVYVAIIIIFSSYLKWWESIENGGYSEQATHKKNNTA